MQPRSADEIVKWQDGYAWLAGGTWLFSTPQIATDTLIDLESLNWPSLEASADGPRHRRDLHHRRADHFQAPADWIAAPLFRLCSRAFLASFKIWNAATVGGNICMSLPAGADDVARPRRSKAATRFWPRDGSRARWRRSTSSPAITRMYCSRASCCAASISRRARSRKRFAFRRSSLTHLGRSAALLDRHADARRARSPAHHHRGDAEAGAAPIRPRAVCRGASPRHRRGSSRRRLFRRRAWLAGLSAAAHLLLCRANPRRAREAWSGA